MPQIQAQTLNVTFIQIGVALIMYAYGLYAVTYVYRKSYMRSWPILHLHCLFRALLAVQPTFVPK